MAIKAVRSKICDEFAGIKALMVAKLGFAGCEMLMLAGKVDADILM
jgi:hypothetical protein